MVVLWLALLAARAWARGGVHPGPAGIPPRELDALEYACLWRGPQHVADTVLLGLMQAGAAGVVVDRKTRVHVDIGARPLPAMLHGFRTVPRGLFSRAGFRREVARQIDAILRELRARGLAPAYGTIRALRFASALIVLPVLALGLAKIGVGLGRGKPVGFLVLMVLVAAGAGLWCLRNPPRVTAAGQAALRQARQRHSRAARAPLGDEIVLAFALSGAAALAGTPHDAFGRLMRADGDGGGGSGCGGGDGGGGDGGGGGCGGCS